ncbi:DUF305 domain-containing protein [Streptomyces niveus]|uniref:DUF305 domain-containing protein n=1 Tax=Streptomyces niveus TaxID=193462 RepID=UPI003448FB1F
MSSIKRAGHRRRLAVAGAITASALLLTACGGEEHSGDHGGGKPAAGAFNDADVAFAQGMIPHHEQAVEMSALADGRASGAEIKTLAAEIEKAQDPEITTMRSWLKAWGEPESADGSKTGMDHGSGGSHGAEDSPGGSGGSGGADGMMSDQDLADLSAAKGVDFDRKFAELMIRHHDGAIAMARDQRKNGESGKVKKLAADVIKAQTAEVEQLNTLLDRL